MAFIALVVVFCAGNIRVCWLRWFIHLYWLTWLIRWCVLADLTDLFIGTGWFYWFVDLYCPAALISLIYTGCIDFIDLYWLAALISLSYTCWLYWFHWSVLADIIDFIDLYWLHSFHWSILIDLIDFIDLYWLTSLISLTYIGWKVERIGCVAIDLYLNSYYPAT